MSAFKKISFNTALGLLATILLGYFVVFEVGLGTYKACASNGRHAIVGAIQRDAIISGQLGAIEDTGCVFGMIYEDPDYAIGTIWLTLEGSLDEGMLYARFMKSKGRWWLTSAQMDLGLAGSFFIDGRRPDQADEIDGGELRVKSMRDNDHPLMADRASAGKWSDVGWPEQRLQFEVPADWRVTQKADDELYLYSGRSDLYLIIHVTSVADFRSSMRFLREKQRKEKRWSSWGRSRPSVFSQIGNLTGHIEWPARGVKMLPWQGYRDHPELGADRITFLFGAETSELFERNRPLFGAILASIEAHD